MLKTQKQRCREPVIAYLINAQQKISRTSSRSRDIVDQLSKRRMKAIQTKSDNNHNRKTIQQKKLKSLNLIPKQEVIIPHQQDQYQLGTRNSDRWKDNKQLQTKYKNNNQCLRDDTSSTNHGQIVSHYRQSKSRYKNGKQKARKLIDKMLASSKNNSEELQNHLKKNVEKYKKQFPAQHNPTHQYGMLQRGIQKYSSTSGSTGFRPKVQKCSTLRFGTKDSSNSSAYKYSNHLSRVSNNSSKHRPSNQSLNGNQSKSKNNYISITRDDRINEKNLKQILQPQKNYFNIVKENSPKNINSREGTTIINSSEDLSNANPLVIKQRLGQYGFTDYDRPNTYKQIEFKPVTQKQINQQSQKASKSASRQMRLSRKQTQKLITRAREKNKKILGRLRQMKQKRSALKNQRSSLYNDLSKSGSRFSKLTGGAFKSNVRYSIIKSRLQQSGYNNNKNNSINDNFLSLNSNIDQNQEIKAINEQIRQKILIHLETIKTIADYAQSFGNIYQDCNQWEDLIFLLYKKYYIERFKTYHIIKNGLLKFKNGDIFNQSPFVFDFCQVSYQDIQAFKQTKQQISLQLQLKTDNYSVKSSLRDLYNKFIQKTAQNSSINMYEVDDFAEQILQDLNEQINMLIQSCGKSTKIKKRINQAIQVGLLIAHLEGYVFQQIEDIAFGEVDERQYFDKYYNKFLQIFADQDQKDLG